ncbi:PREDICTED: leukocyte-associated immunoglobulin-like receptor 2 isoform X2 [Hipposideros armiger]|uniref:Leukocyte-associated immunoglobulin-like receptor 2 isoform X2 n=1 Tax=Hipposideros armiger TaxID=186990 RepID=A0A8B7PXT4_HIPAR|nr:PREDICTED: leukocyte-associated immunoglobulin-like receptor 2 isoform X2 [Hipposideros armiger]
MLAMSSNPTTLLGLMLCLGQVIHMQNGRLPRPSIRAEPGPVVARGRPVTILCGGPAGVHRFRLEQKENTSTFMDQKNIPQRGSLETEARFLIPAVSEVTAGPYRCAYMKGSSWSERSEFLELKLKDEPVPVLPSGAPHEVTHPHTEAGSQTGVELGSVTQVPWAQATVSAGLHLRRFQGCIHFLTSSSVYRSSTSLSSGSFLHLQASNGGASPSPATCRPPVPIITSLSLTLPAASLVHF